MTTLSMGLYLDQIAAEFSPTALGNIGTDAINDAGLTAVSADAIATAAQTKAQEILAQSNEPMADADWEAMRALGWKPSSASDYGYPIAAQAPNGAKRGLSRQAWRYLIQEGARAPGFVLPPPPPPEPVTVVERAPLFSYANLDAETRIVVQQRTGEIRDRLRQTAQGIIEIGERLIDVKERLPHGQFETWLLVEFEMSPGHARKLMQVARAFAGQNDHRDRFAPTALYLLAAPSAPDGAREEALERAAAGEMITPAVARQIVAAHTPTPAASDEDDDDEPLTDFERQIADAYQPEPAPEPASAPAPSRSSASSAPAPSRSSASSAPSRRTSAQSHDADGEPLSPYETSVLAAAQQPRLDPALITTLERKFYRIVGHRMLDSGEMDWELQFPHETGCKAPFVLRHCAEQKLHGIAERAPMFDPDYWVNRVAALGGRLHSHGWTWQFDEPSGASTTYRAYEAFPDLIRRIERVEAHRGAPWRLDEADAEARGIAFSVPCYDIPVDWDAWRARAAVLGWELTLDHGAIASLEGLSKDAQRDATEDAMYYLRTPGLSQWEMLTALIAKYEPVCDEPLTIEVYDGDGVPTVTLRANGLERYEAEAIAQIAEALRLLALGQAHAVDTALLDSLYEHTEGIVSSVLGQILDEAEVGV